LQLIMMDMGHRLMTYTTQLIPKMTYIKVCAEDVHLGRTLRNISQAMKTDPKGS